MTAVIEVTGLSKHYRGQAAVDGISFHVDKGEIFGILGPNGAGKTTAVECLEGLRKRDGGQVRILGLDPRTDGHRLHQRIGVQLQETQLPEKLKVREALQLYASFYPDPADWREPGEGEIDRLEPQRALQKGGAARRIVAAQLLGQRHGAHQIEGRAQYLVMLRGNERRHACRIGERRIGLHALGVPARKAEQNQGRQGGQRDQKDEASADRAQPGHAPILAACPAAFTPER